MNGKYQIEMADGRFAGQLGVAEISAPVATAKNPQPCPNWRIFPTTG